jgi:hypothetical protein
MILRLKGLAGAKDDLVDSNRSITSPEISESKA